jgi:hypothetical protein
MAAERRCRSRRRELHSRFSCKLMQRRGADQRRPSVVPATAGRTVAEMNKTDSFGLATVMRPSRMASVERAASWAPRRSALSERQSAGSGNVAASCPTQVLRVSRSLARNAGPCRGSLRVAPLIAAGTKQPKRRPSVSEFRTSGVAVSPTGLSRTRQLGGAGRGVPQMNETNPGASSTRAR